MTFLWVGLGLVVAGLWWGTVVWRREQADPWINPPTPEARRLLRAASLHLHCHILGRPAVDQDAPSFVGVDALQALYLRDGVIFFEKGIATLPDGTQVELGALTHEVLEVLRETYSALDAASAVITDYATTFNTPEELEKSENEILRKIAGYGNMYPMQSAIARLALLLNLDPDKNDVGIGGKVLWERIRRWRWPERHFSAEQ
ncbi:MULTISPECIES: hypothetical protein [Pseudomonadota]|jgi:hypothetical protein|uniref:Uncharacterized protein n=7 Tax=Pseudomonadota TaxID=1224 RepID=A0A2S1PJD5_PSEFL|nr:MULTISPECIES: hypothetical protein [Pseudomonadota]AEK25458.1 hypothetical protein [Pseudomonas putida DOT-T1E]AEK25480.1 hypothetical protein [Pseudomonas putida DOT-T1E]AGZ38224.1 hypothetical protein PVLB_27437 [Pseudomonas sp. VLB120]AHZ78134.1 hypothetical protein DW66_3628 [Pseudomonas putida]AHZ78290.1 hypothetical protein DW66_3785 [Pseudomonas putida]|tara:strand:- start:19703 stop:20311 length:609 start_codon:yes stop_codon:yes gene_type:complete